MNFNDKIGIIRNNNYRIKENNIFKDNAKELLIKYNEALTRKQMEYDNIKIRYEDLENKYNKIPKIIRKIFIKEVS